MCWIIWAYSLNGEKQDLWNLALALLRWNENRWQDWYWLSVLLNNWELQTFKFIDLNGDAQAVIDSIKKRIVWIIWHARYPTSWWQWTSTEYTQPFELNHLRHWMAFAFNWNIVNAEELAQELEKSDWITIKRPILDTNVLKYMILSRVKSWETDLKKIFEFVNNKIDWSCNIVLLSKNGDFAFSKDRLWFRPLSWEIKDWVLMISSESSALFKVWWDDNPNFLEAWEIVYINWWPNWITEWKLDLKEKIVEKSCFFESVYFANPKTTLWWKSTNLHRYRLGYKLANNETEKFSRDDTVVVDIPSSSLHSAQWYSEKLDLPLLSWVITKSPKSLRTFIAWVFSRDEKIKKKYIFNPNLIEFIKWKKVVLLDDSIVRWSTMEYLVKAFIEFYEPEEVHLRIPSPPVTSPCFYWINMPNIQELVVREYFEDVNYPTEIELDNLARKFWADSLKYLYIDWLIKAIWVEKEQLCLACVNSDYPTKWWQAKYEEQLKKVA